MHRLILGLALALTPVGVVAQDWWHGFWADERKWCVNADKIGGAEPAPLAITDRELLGYEISCVITYVDDMPDAGAVRLTLACDGEGEHYEEERLLLNSGDGSMWMWFGEGEPIRFLHCLDEDMQ